MSAPSAKELLASYDVEQRYCNLCPRLCRHSCPVENAERDESVTPMEKNSAVLLVRLGVRELDEDVADRMYACSGCRLCQSFCEHDNDLAGSLFAARAVAVESGVEIPAVAQVRRRWDERGHLYGPDLRAPLESLPPERRVGREGSVRLSLENVPTVPGRGVQVYWPGCTTLEERPDLVKRTLAVADQLGEADLVVWDGEPLCCGYPMLAAGHLGRFRENAEKVALALEGADTLYTGAPECAWTLTDAYRDVLGLEVPVERVGHVVDLFLPALQRAPTRAPLELDAVWHDPCYLGRFLGKYDEPRTLVNRILAQPMGEVGPWTREKSYCCGGGGLLPWTRPETADAITATRVADLTGSTVGVPAVAPPTGRTIVTACPTCSSRFEKAGAKSVDIVDLLADYLGIE